MTHSTLSFRMLLAAGVIALTAAAPVRAQPFKELPYNPPVGSQWILRSTTNSLEARSDGKRSETTIKLRAALTIDSKTADGFRIIYAIRDVAVTGDANKVNFIGPSYEALKGLVFHARVDTRGAPVAIDNLEEIRKGIQAMVDRMMEKVADNPHITAVLRQMMSGMLTLQGPQAAAAYLDTIWQLAVGQGTGLTPGKVRSSTEQVQSPIGNVAIKSKVTFGIGEFDSVRGKIRFVRERSIDPEALKDSTLALIKRLGSADKPVPPPLLEVMKSMTVALNEHIDIDVEGGMTRAIHARSTLTVTVKGQPSTKIETKTVTLTPVQ